MDQFNAFYLIPIFTFVVVSVVATLILVLVRYLRVKESHVISPIIFSLNKQTEKIKEEVTSIFIKENETITIKNFFSMFDFAEKNNIVGFLSHKNTSILNNLNVRVKLNKVYVNEYFHLNIKIITDSDSVFIYLIRDNSLTEKWNLLQKINSIPNNPFSIDVRMERWNSFFDRKDSTNIICWLFNLNIENNFRYIYDNSFQKSLILLFAKRLNSLFPGEFLSRIEQDKFVLITHDKNLSEWQIHKKIKKMENNYLISEVTCNIDSKTTVMSINEVRKTDNLSEIIQTALFMNAASFQKSTSTNIFWMKNIDDKNMEIDKFLLAKNKILEDFKKDLVFDIAESSFSWNFKGKMTWFYNSMIESSNFWQKVNAFDLDTEILFTYIKKLILLISKTEFTSKQIIIKISAFLEINDLEKIVTKLRKKNINFQFSLINWTAIYTNHIESIIRYFRNEKISFGLGNVRKIDPKNHVFELYKPNFISINSQFVGKAIENNDFYVNIVNVVNFSINNKIKCFVDGKINEKEEHFLNRLALPKIFQTKSKTGYQTKQKN